MDMSADMDTPSDTHPHDGPDNHSTPDPAPAPPAASNNGGNSVHAELGQRTDISTADTEAPSKPLQSPSIAPSDAEWIPVPAAARMIGVTDRTIRRWAIENVVDAKRTADGWIVRADTLPQLGRTRKPHTGVRLEVEPEMSILRDKLVDLAMQVGYWRGMAQEQQKLLPEARITIEKRELDLSTIRKEAEILRRKLEMAQAKCGLISHWLTDWLFQNPSTPAV